MNNFVASHANDETKWANIISAMEQSLNDIQSSVNAINNNINGIWAIADPLSKKVATMNDEILCNEDNVGIACATRLHVVTSTDYNDNPYKDGYVATHEGVSWSGVIENIKICTKCIINGVDLDNDGKFEAKEGTADNDIMKQITMQIEDQLNNGELDVNKEELIAKIKNMINASALPEGYEYTVVWSAIKKEWAINVDGQLLATPIEYNYTVDLGNGDEVESTWNIEELNGLNDLATPTKSDEVNYRTITSYTFTGFTYTGTVNDETVELVIENGNVYYTTSEGTLERYLGDVAVKANYDSTITPYYELADYKREDNKEVVVNEEVVYLDTNDEKAEITYEETALSGASKTSSNGIIKDTADAYDYYSSLNIVVLLLGIIALAFDLKNKGIISK